MDNLVKVDKYGRKHVSGVVSGRPLTSEEIFSIGKESVFPVIFKAKLNDNQQYIGNGTAFVYKQIIHNEFSEIFLFTNLHVIQTINQVYPFSMKSEEDIYFSLVLGLKDKDIEIEEVIIPKGIYFDFVTNPDAFRFLDFAIIKLKIDINEPLIFFSIKKDLNLLEGNKVYALGYPQGLNLSITDGIISHIYGEDDKTIGGENIHKNVFQHNILINPGNSGGPTINEYGNVVGISTYGKIDSQGINFSLNIYSILEFIQNPENLEKFNVKDFIKSLKIEAKRLKSVL